MLIDKAARDEALRTDESFIVQAPAGSGKTELLTQRFLALLSTVKSEPEEVLAITFTKKAALEMRTRVIRCLQDAYCRVEPPETEHEKKTYALSRGVLQRDKEENWGLLKNANRLNIQTIDAFCASLAKKLPLLSGIGVAGEVIEHAVTIYEQTAEAVLQGLDADHPWSDAIATLLDYYDNQRPVVLELLAEMLAMRDQWLPYCVTSDNETLKKQLEQGLDTIINEELVSIDEALTPFKPTIFEFARYAANQSRAFSLALSVENWAELATFPEATIETLPLWQSLASWLLTTTGDIRKTVTKAQGFVAMSAFKNKAEKEEAKLKKEGMKDLLASLTESSKVARALTQLSNLPNASYSEASWGLLTALLQILPVAAAELKLTLKSLQAVDFIEITQAALQALGDEDNPTDLALALDYRLSHILVDEFQDTSTSQWLLLEKLILGWQQGDGRTLFLVGDPMQSIYRFRQAEVGLFLRAQKQGIGDLALTPLHLEANFRAAKNLVLWHNLHFSSIFPEEASITTSAVSYHPSHAIHEYPDSGVFVHPVIDNRYLEAEETVRQVLHALENNPDDSIAILVRSRSHLDEICPLLAAHNIPYNGVEITPLHHNAMVQDCIALTRACCDENDKIAWLALLRAPWCGLTLTDLHLLCEEESRTIWAKIQDESITTQLSQDGQDKLTRVVSVLTQSMPEVGRIPLSQCIKATWIALGTPSWLTESDKQDINQYFELLETLSLQQVLVDVDKLMTKILQSYSQVKDAKARVEIMTIHKAKGLEFDVVIVPGLGRPLPHESHRLLNWIDITSETKGHYWLLAPYMESYKTDDGIYAYIRSLHKQKSEQERIRLLYVALTRAKKKIHLIGTAKSSDDGTISVEPGSFLSLLWPHIKDVFHETELPWEDELEEDEDAANLQFLPLNWQLPSRVKENFFAVYEAMNNPTEPSHYRWQDDFVQVRGTILHRLFYEVAISGLDHILWQDNSALTKRITQLCRHYGVAEPKLADMIQVVQEIMKQTLDSETGRWVLASYAEAENEYALTGLLGNQVVTGVVDRLFVDENDERWLIDYKFVIEKPKDIQQFLSTQMRQYRRQLENYAHLLHQSGMTVDHVALYFPALDILSEVDIVDVCDT